VNGGLPRLANADGVEALDPIGEEAEHAIRPLEQNAYARNLHNGLLRTAASIRAALKHLVSTGKLSSAADHPEQVRAVQAFLLEEGHNLEEDIKEPYMMYSQALRPKGKNGSGGRSKEARIATLEKEIARLQEELAQLQTEVKTEQLADAQAEIHRMLKVFSANDIQRWISSAS